MNTKNSVLFLFTISIFLTVSFLSCNNDDDSSSSPGTLAFHLHTFVDTTEVENYGDTILLSDGRQIAVTTAQLYLSNIKLIKLDGSVVNGPSTIVWLKQGVEEYEIGAVPAGNYKSVRFDVGLSDSINASTPAVSDPILNQASMWFGSAAQPEGYVFINFQGIIDTTIAATGTQLTPFTCKIGTNANRVTITMPEENFTVVPNQQSIRHILANYSKLFEGIDLSVNSNLNITNATQNTSPTAQKMVSNILNMFEYEE